MVAFQAGCFNEAIGQHGEVPVFAAIPILVLDPMISAGRQYWENGRRERNRCAALPGVARRAAEFLGRVRTVFTHEKIEPRMSTVLGNLRSRKLYVLDLGRKIAGIETQCILGAKTHCAIILARS